MEARGTRNRSVLIGLPSPAAKGIEESVRHRRIEPGPGQESVWDYPRPPRVERSDRAVTVVLGGVEIARTSRAHRVLETCHPPVYSIPIEDIVPGALRPVAGTTFCEFKGEASYLDVVGGAEIRPRAAWTYRDPTPGYEALVDTVAFYPSRMDAAYVEGEQVQAQEGDFYGGWITADIVGPFKGGAGTWGW